MKEILILNTSRDGYAPDQIDRTMTAGELAIFLNGYDYDTPVYLSFDRGYTYGGITEYKFEESELEDDDDEEEFEEDEEEDRITDDVGTNNFNDYEDFVYQNTSLSKEQAREVAREGWNKGIHKYDLVKKFNA